MLKDVGMADGFWPEAHQYSNHVRNRTPTAALNKQHRTRLSMARNPMSALFVYLVRDVMTAYLKRNGGNSMPIH